MPQESGGSLGNQCPGQASQLIAAYQGFVYHSELEKDSAPREAKGTHLTDIKGPCREGLWRPGLAWPGVSAGNNNQLSLDTLEYTYLSFNFQSPKTDFFLLDSR